MANRTLTTLTAVLQMNNTKFKKGISGSQKALGGLSKSIMNIGGTIAAAFSVRAITNFTKESFRLLDIQSRAEQRLLTALNGRISAQRELLQQARALQKVTLYGDEETIIAQGLLATMVNEEAVIKRLIPLVQDFATTKQMQLSVAADLVSKTIGSGTNALSRYGITVEGAVGSSERLESLVNSLSKAFKGQAEAAAVAEKNLAQVKNAWGDLQEQFASWLSEGEGGFIRRGLMAGIEDATKLFEKSQNPEALKAFDAFMDSIKDEKPARQAELLAAEIERQHRAVWDMAATRKALNKEEEEYTGKFARQKRIDIKQQIDAIDQQQDHLIEVRHLFEAQLKALQGIGDEIDDITNTKLPKLKTVAEHILPEGFEKAFGAGVTKDNWGTSDVPGVLKQLSWEKEPAMLTGLEATNKIATLLQGTFDDLEDSIQASLGDETFAKVDKVNVEMESFGQNVGMMLVSQFDRLGESIGKFASGADDAFKGLGDSIMQNLGNILIMMGAQTGNIPLVLAGIGLQLGGGILRGLGNNSPSASSNMGYGSNNVNFRISGRDLVGTLDRYNYHNNLVT